MIRVSQTLEQEVMGLLVQAVRSGSFELPQLPRIVNQVLELPPDPSASMRSIGALLADDAVLESRVLQLANSGRFHRAQPADTLQRAMVRVGVDNLKQLLLTYALQGSVFRSAELAAPMYEVWRHCVGVAIAADLIARQRKADIHLPFIGGLIHDVGRAVALRAIASLRRSHPGLKQASPERLLSVADAVHARLGAVVGARWALPAALKEVMAHHHAGAAYKGEARELICTVGAADHLARMCGLGYGEQEPLSMDAARLFAALGLGRADVEAVAGALEKRAETLVGAA